MTALFPSVAEGIDRRVSTSEQFVQALTDATAGARILIAPGTCTSEDHAVEYSCLWKVSKKVRIRWNAKRFPETHDGQGDVTVAEVGADVTETPAGKRLGYFGAFVLDAKDRWSEPTPDGVHRFALSIERAGAKP